MRCFSRPSRLLKKAHLQRWCARTLAAAYLEYASLGPARAALHLDPFEQPGRKRVLQHPASQRRWRFLFFLLVLSVGVLSVLYTAPEISAETHADLTSRLDEAIRHVESTQDTGAPLPDVSSLFPATEEVSWDEGTLRIDNSSLWVEWGAVPADGAPRREALERLKRRLVAVRAQVDSQGSGVSPPAGWQEKLSGTMNRPEFKKRPAEDPLLAQIMRWLIDKLSFLFPQSVQRDVGAVVGWIIYILAVAALLPALIILVRTVLPLLRWDRRIRPASGTPATAEPETPEGLLTLADARTHDGDFRGAVQAMFRWMLLSLHQAGRLGFDPALTNREHIHRLKANAGVRAAFADLSRQFELVWYGLHAVSAKECAAFRTGCQNLVGGRA